MKGSIYLRKFLRKNKIMVSVVLLLLVVSLSSLAYAYSFNLNTLDGVETVKYSSAAEVDAINNVLNGVASASIEEETDIVAVTPPPILVADENDSEDPQKIAAKIKGSSTNQQDIKSALKNMRQMKRV